ncbi:hypothetical protein D3C74_368760 [compost metagenome]
MFVQRLKQMIRAIFKNRRQHPEVLSRSRIVQPFRSIQEFTHERQVIRQLAFRHFKAVHFIHYFQFGQDLSALLGILKLKIGHIKGAVPLKIKGRGIVLLNLIQTEVLHERPISMHTRVSRMSGFERLFQKGRMIIKLFRIHQLQGEISEG